MYYVSHISNRTIELGKAVFIDVALNTTNYTYEQSLLNYKNIFYSLLLVL